MSIFLDGTGITPGTEKCRCGNDCEFPCWQRLGIAPACSSCGCPGFPDGIEEFLPTRAPHNDQHDAVRVLSRRGDAQ